MSKSFEELSNFVKPLYSIKPLYSRIDSKIDLKIDLQLREKLGKLKDRVEGFRNDTIEKILDVDESRKVGPLGRIIYVGLTAMMINSLYNVIHLPLSYTPKNLAEYVGAWAVKAVCSSTLAYLAVDGELTATTGVMLPMTHYISEKFKKQFKK